jgi:hypothetical protein
MARDNISALLKNVFAIAVHGELTDKVKGIVIKNESQINDINTAMQSLDLYMK